MPQLDFNNTLTISQVVWMALIFGALYLLLTQWALPQVASVIDDRASRIASDLSTARVAKEEADAAVAEVRHATRRAAADAQMAIGAAMAQAKAEATSNASAADKQLDAQLSEAERRIAAARTAAMNALHDVATDTAMVVISRLTGRDADRIVVDDAVRAALATKG